MFKKQYTSVLTLALTLTCFHTISFAETHMPAEQEKYQVLQSCYQDYLSQIQKNADLRQAQRDQIIDYYEDSKISRNEDYRLLLSWISSLPEKVKKRSYTRLLRASIRRGSIEALNVTYQTSEDLLTADDQGRILFYAVESNNMPAVEFALTLKPQKRFVNNAFDQAVEKNNIKILIRLLQAYPAYIQDDILMQTVMFKDNADMFTVLEQKGALKQIQGKAYAGDVIVGAARVPHTRYLERLKAQGLDLKIQNSQAENGIFAAAEHSTVEVLKYLLGEGLKINTLNQKGQHALFAAAQAKTADNYIFLIQQGLDPELQDTEGKTAWDQMLEHNSAGDDFWLDLAIAQLISNARLSMQDEMGRYPYFERVFGSITPANYKQARPVLLKYLSDKRIQSIFKKTAQQIPELPFGLVEKSAQEILDYLVVLEEAAAPQDRVRESSVKANMHTVQTLVETYAVEHENHYPPDVQTAYEASRHWSCTGQPYWKVLTNPYTQGQTLPDVLIDYHNYVPELLWQGRVVYQPIADEQGNLSTYKIYGVKQDGGLLKERGRVFTLNNF